MIRNKKDNEPVTQAALTRAEAEQILSGKRDQIYRCVRRCRNACESSEWLVQTDKAKGFYQKIGFEENKDYFLTIPGKWF